MRVLLMSKTFTGSISVDFKMVLSDQALVVLESTIQLVDGPNGRPGFAEYVQSLPTVDERMQALIKQSFRDRIKENLQEVVDATNYAGATDSFTFSPVTVTVKGKE
ncbi:hypothetical protein MA2_17 [Pectobacterium phage MA2]|uniref:Uncharacterized protein n=1 Tax=Pectobacterium phage MA2 TaxID=2608298 RepID=A0A5Q2F413_9CAUD|nr:hypothetical protein MA2_17 [Pectobacterium phage MA2]